jgi:hypothetical protein
VKFPDTISTGDCAIREVAGIEETGMRYQQALVLGGLGTHSTIGSSVMRWLA